MKQIKDDTILLVCGLIVAAYVFYVELMGSPEFIVIAIP